MLVLIVVQLRQNGWDTLGLESLTLNPTAWEKSRNHLMFYRDNLEISRNEYVVRSCVPVQQY